MKKLLLALALLVPTEAAAATWRKAAESQDERTTGWVDVSSIRTSKTGKTAWVRLNLDSGSWATSFIAVRCSVKTYYEAKVVYYEPDGSSNDLTADQPKWKLATPDSIMDGILDMVCDDTSY